jgi:hypothetical protein
MHIYCLLFTFLTLNHAISVVGALQQEIGAYKRGFVMASLNINSLTAQIDEVRIFTHDTNIDILAINETKLDASVHSL